MLHVGITYPRILLGLIITDFLLTFIVPSGIARVVIMASIALGLAEAFNSRPGSNVSRGMFLILSYTANIFDKMIIAGAGSITAPGLIEKVGGVEVLWSYWFIAFPASRREREGTAPRRLVAWIALRGTRSDKLPRCGRN
jgi:di/tricarboxylate transporter